MKLNLIIPVLFVSIAVSAVTGAFCKANLGMIGSGNKCTIVNHYTYEPLYPGNNTSNYDVKRRSVFTWKLDDCGDQCYWKIETIHTDPCFKFKLRSLYYGEYLHAASDDMKYDDYSRNVFAWVPKTGLGNQSYWQIDNINSYSSRPYVSIKNTEFDEYLCQENGYNYDNHQGRVFTKKTSDSNCYWVINCK